MESNPCGRRSLPGMTLLAFASAYRRFTAFRGTSPRGRCTTSASMAVTAHSGLGGRAWGSMWRWRRDLDIRFRDELGRKGDSLASGDDTTFVADMSRHGAREVFLDRVEAFHHVAPDRLSFSYLLRRASWQGRSEFRRRMVWAGLLKEWRRYTLGSDQRLLQYALAATYVTAFSVGVMVESVTRTELRR